MSISLAIISRIQDLEGAYRAIASVQDYVDEVCLTIADKQEYLSGGIIKEDKKYKVSYFEWVDDFSAARSYNFSQCTGDWILWLDSDDVLLGADKLKDLIKTAEENRVSGLAFKYKYNHDQNGNCIDEHWKMQLLKNDGHFEWKGAIHEDPIQKVSVNWSKSNDCVRVHSNTPEKTKESYERNLKILEKERIKNPKEPRTLFYLGRTYFASGQFEKAIEVLVEYLDLSGWDEERYEATLLIGQVYSKNNQLDDALTWYNQALLEKEVYPDAYIYKGMCYLQKEEYQKAIANFENAQTKQKPDANTYYNPMLYARDLIGAMAVCYMNLGQFEKALAYAEHCLKVDKDNEEMKTLYSLVKEIKDKMDTAKEYTSLAKKLEQENVKALLYSVPKRLLDNPLIVNLRMKYLPPHKWEDDSIVVYCGNSPEVWTPKSVDSGGIGGSETAVIELSKRLVKVGWKVTVYANCGAKPEGDNYDGVEYKNYWDFNYFDEYNILWIWRLPEMLDYNPKAKVILLDLHDVINPLDINKERAEKITKIMVKSKYHRGLLPNVPDDKFEIIGNGINLDKFVEHVKDPYKFIYASTPNRGLDILLDSKIWDTIKTKYPKATLHTFYGWNTFYELEKHNPERMAYMKKMQKLMEKDGVVNHGRVGQKELAEEEATSSYWLYPTFFPEIHCITACEMQAAGVVPITSGYAALEETQQSGIKLEGDVYDPEWQEKYLVEVLSLLEDKEKTKQLSKQAKSVANQFSWDLVAEKWNNLCQKLENQKNQKH